jgi:hypothetical protein
MKYLFLFVILIGCNPLRHYQKVATDPNVTAEKKAIIAPFMSVHFPPEIKYVKGENITTSDTVMNYYFYRDTLTNRDTVVKEIKITDTKVRVDTVYRDNPGFTNVLRRARITAEANELTARIEKRDAELKLAAAKSNNRDYILWIIILAVANAVQIYLRIRKIL